MRFLLGLVIGALCGGGGVYLALEKPWDSAPAATVTEDAGPQVAEAKPENKKRRRGKRGKRGNRVEIPIDGEIPELSAADRKMLWKGDAVKLPERTLDFASGEEGRPLTGGEINGTISGQSSRVVECITSARGNAPLEAQIMIKMLVGGDGTPDKIRVRAPAYLFANGFYPCARRAARAMRFPATGAPTVVEAPYDLY